jgi:hypothetical protein
MTRALALVGALGLFGCAVEAGSNPPPRRVVSTGVLVVDWSISGYQDESYCRQSDADAISVVIDGEGEFEEACESFQTSIELAPGTYTGDAVLLDPSGNARTTAVDLGLIDIRGNDELVVPIDFPPDAFY